jgi:hypothetical protein
MKKALLLMLLIFTTMISAAEEDINLPFTPDSAKYWQYISDRTMGGYPMARLILSKMKKYFLQDLQAM